MKTLKQFIIKEFENLFPRAMLTAPELAAIIEAVYEWLEQKRQETGNKIMYDPLIRRQVLDELLKELRQ